MSLSLLPGFYHARRMAHLGERRGIILPDVVREAYTDAVVITAGPNRKRKAQQAAVGDRILCSPVCFETLQGDEGFVADPDLLGVIRAPDFAYVEPAGNYVLIKPDPRERVKATSGGILVAGYSLAGEGRREKERGFELLNEYAAILDSNRYREEPTDADKYRLEQAFFDNLSPSDQLSFSDCLDKQREEAFSDPGERRVTLEESSYRAKAPLRLPDPLMSGVIMGLGPDVREELELDSRVSWSRNHLAVRLMVGGTLQLLIPEKCLECVVSQDALLEWRKAA